jgi:hypothetical protein
MPRVGFEPTIPMFKRAKTVHALDRAATVFGFLVHLLLVKHTHSSTQYQRTQSTPTDKHVIK